LKKTDRKLHKDSKGKNLIKIEKLKNCVRWSLLVPSDLENSKSYIIYVAILQTEIFQRNSMGENVYKSDLK
jgi:hypothetical protein